MISWSRTPNGWAVNLDGTDAAREFRLPRIELNSGPHGWTCICHLENGTSRQLPVGSSAATLAAKRAAVAEAMHTLGEQYEPALRALLA